MQALIILATFLVALTSAREWWENGNFYQIYPRSFMDSNGDGIGDLRGITTKLRYLKKIGMDGAWISPIFQSPMEDFGYDCSDYYAIQPEFGTIDDFQALLDKANELGIKIILDFVPNHTSNKHNWFKMSEQRIDPYTDFYIWENGTYDEASGKHLPPNNWICSFRYSAWEWSDKRQQFYLHQFGVFQPDLNYRNPAVHQAMADVVRFWLNKGVGGFRIDAVPFMYEVSRDPTTGKIPDEPVAEGNACPDPDDWCHLKHIHTQDRNETFELVYDWRDIVDKFSKDKGDYQRILMTEAYTSLDNIIRYYGNGVRNGSHVPFNFEMFSNSNNKSTAQDFSNFIDSWLERMPKDVYANWVLGNHDNNRISARYGTAKIDMLNILVQTLPGHAVTYYGDEIGMKNVYVSYEETVDPQGINAGPDRYRQLSRDPERSPMQWDWTHQSGFSTANKTWLPVYENYKNENVFSQLLAKKSHLKVFMTLTEIRKNASFQKGSFEKSVADNVLVYKREQDEAYVVILNFNDEPKTVNIKEIFPAISNQVKVVTSSVQSEQREGNVINSDAVFVEGNVGIVVVGV
ncbi:Mal-A1.2 family protein [Megaselia abdita]